MLTALVASVASLLFGGSDFFGGLASRRDSALAVVADSHFIQMFILTAAALLMPAIAVAPRDLAFGALTGITGGLGVVALYAALAAGRMGIVSPIAAALAGAIPAAFDLIRGTAVGPRSIGGLVLALVAVIIVSFAPGEHEAHEMPLRAVVLAVIAGVGFGVGFISLSYAGAGSGLWPLVAARVASAGILSVLLLTRERRLLVSPAARSVTVSAAVFEGIANIAVLSAIRMGPLAVASVLGSMFPVVVLVLARVVLHERLLWLQRVGVLMALVAVVLTALP